MKIILTTHQFFPQYTSGTEVLTLSVARELRQRGHEVLVFTGYPAQRHMVDQERLDTYEFEGIPVVRFHHAVVPMGEQSHVTELEYCNLVAAGFFKKVINDFQPDVIHFFHMSRLGAALMDVAFANGIPAYYTPTDFWAICPTSQLLLANGSMCPGPSHFAGNCVKHVACLTRGAATKRVLAWVPDSVAEVLVGMTARGLMPPYRYKDEVAALSRRKAFVARRLNALQKIVSPTQLMTRLLVSNGVEPKRILQASYGIDTSKFTPSNRKPTDSTAITIGFIGTLAEHKGCHVLLQALALEMDLPVQLKIYGRDSDFPDYYALLTALAGNDTRVEFCGSFPNSAIANVFAGIDLLVVPSVWYENTPLVIYSALAAQCPVVASNLPGMAEAVEDEVNGLLFAPGDARALASQLRRIQESSSLLEHLRQNCRQPKSTQTYVQELLDLYVGPKEAPPKEPWLSVQEMTSAEASAGFLSGWAVVGNDSPTAAQLLVNHEVVCECRRMAARPDVVEGLRKSGMRVSSIKLGFSLTIPMGVTRELCSIRLIGTPDKQIQMPLQDLTVGQVSTQPEGTLLAIDSECWN